MMSKKLWGELTAEEKTEDLRKDFNHMMAQLNMLIQGQDVLRSRVDSLAARLDELTDRLAPSEKKEEERG